MRREHLSWEIDAYLNNKLLPQNQQKVKDHLRRCEACAQQLANAQNLNRDLHIALKSTLGQPAMPAGLRRRTQQKLALQTTGAPRPPRFYLGGVVSAATTLLVIVLVGASAFLLIRAQLPSTPTPPEESALQAGPPAQQTQPATSAPTPTPTNMAPTATVTPMQEAIAPPIVPPTDEPGAQAETPEPAPSPTATLKPTALPVATGVIIANIPDPKGKIAFSFFNPAPQRQVYEIHLIDPDSANHALFPVDGVSEPAIRSTENGLQLAYRSWGQASNPRSLISSSIDSKEQNQIGGFWEDAQPDWSPVEDRLIYASQREVDRRWRLYTSRADGSGDIALNREGRSPSFAPDGRRFVYAGCDETGNQCGLWQAALGGGIATSILADSTANEPDWSPTGEWIVFMANSEENWELYLIKSDGTERRRLTANAAIDGLPVWSPDGEWLAFLSDRGGQWGIWILHPQSGELRPVFTFDGGMFTPPHQAPYGERDWWDEQLGWSL